MTYYVYVITHLETSRFYVGFTSNPLQRWCNHFDKSKSYSHNVLNAYGAKAFEFKILQTFNNKQTALDAERYWISLLRSHEHEYGFNLTYGGECWPQNAIVNGGKSAGHKVLIERWKSDRIRMLKIVKQNGKTTGKLAAQSWLLKYNKSDHGRKRSAELMTQVGKNRAKRVKQLSVENNIVIHEYDSITQAATTLGIAYTTLCWGLKVPGRTVGGFLWQFANKD